MRRVTTATLLRPRGRRRWGPIEATATARSLGWVAAASWEGERLEPVSQVPPRPREALRLLTLNLSHGWSGRPHHAFVRPQRVRDNLLQVGEELRDLRPDVVALQEADGPSSWSGNLDHVATLAALAELTDFFRGEHHPERFDRLGLSWGTALLARHPLHGAASHRFAAAWRDTKGFVVATVEVPAWRQRAIDVVSVHLDFLRPAVRRRQIATLADVLGHRRRPLVLLGDLNCCWRREPRSMELLTTALGLRAFRPDLHGPTFPSFRPVRQLDWILISEELEFAGYHTVAAPASDHLAVVADLRFSLAA